MPDPGRFAAFALASFLLIIVPGPNLIYILTNGVARGRRAGLVSAFGVEVGTLIHIALAVLGLSSVVATSELAFNIIKYAGAAYLVYLGVRALILRRNALDLSAEVSERPLSRLFWDGVIVNVLNPKVALFFLAFLPQFVPQGADLATARSQMLAYGVLFFAIALTLDIMYALVAHAASARLRDRPSAMRAQPYLTGGVYLSLAAYAALT